jgi:Fic family protein
MEGAATVDRLDAEALRQIDARYTPFPPFSAWSRLDIPLRVWESERAELTARRQGAGADALAASVRKAMQAAAADTGAIEGLYAHDRGFTISVATEVAAWEVELSKKPDDVRALLESQLLAYELALDAATRNTPISEAWIRRLHEVLTAAQAEHEVHVWIGDQLVRQRQTLPHGEYKRFPNHVRLRDGGFHPYAPVLATRDEMTRLVRELGSDEFASAHPVLQAAYAHYGLVAIHPFADGNGRVARALASVYLLRAVSMPLVIFYEQRNSYFESLAAADGGRPEPFVRLIRDASVDMLRIVSDQLRPGPETYASDLERLLTVPGGIAVEDLARAARALLPLVRDEFSRQLDASPLPRGVQKHASVSGGGLRYTMKGYQHITSPDGSLVYVRLHSETPSAVASAYVAAFVGAPDSDEPLLLVFERRSDAPREHFRVRVSEVHPEPTIAFRARLASWVRALLGELVAELVHDLTNVLSRTEEPSS